MTEQLGIGMYVRTRGQSSGRIVDKRVMEGTLWWIVKLPSGAIIRCRSNQISPR